MFGLSKAPSNPSSARSSTFKQSPTSKSKNVKISGKGNPTSRPIITQIWGLAACILVTLAVIGVLVFLRQTLPHGDKDDYRNFEERAPVPLDKRSPTHQPQSAEVEAASTVYTTRVIVDFTPIVETAATSATVLLSRSGGVVVTAAPELGKKPVLNHLCYEPTSWCQTFISISGGDTGYEEECSSTSEEPHCLCEAGYTEYCCETNECLCRFGYYQYCSHGDDETDDPGTKIKVRNALGEMASERALWQRQEEPTTVVSSTCIWAALSLWGCEGVPTTPPAPVITEECYQPHFVCNDLQVYQYFGGTKMKRELDSGRNVPRQEDKEEEYCWTGECCTWEQGWDFDEGSDCHFGDVFTPFCDWTSVSMEGCPSTATITATIATTISLNTTSPSSTTTSTPPPDKDPCYTVEYACTTTPIFPDPNVEETSACPTDEVQREYLCSELGQEQCCPGNYVPPVTEITLCDWTSVILPGCATTESETTSTVEPDPCWTTDTVCDVFTTTMERPFVAVGIVTSTVVTSLCYTTKVSLSGCLTVTIPTVVTSTTPTTAPINTTSIVATTTIASRPIIGDPCYRAVRSCYDCAWTSVSMPGCGDDCYTPVTACRESYTVVTDETDCKTDTFSRVRDCGATVRGCDATVTSCASYVVFPDMEVGEACGPLGYESVEGCPTTTEEATVTTSTETDPVVTGDPCVTSTVKCPGFILRLRRQVDMEGGDGDGVVVGEDRCTTSSYISDECLEVETTVSETVSSTVFLNTTTSVATDTEMPPMTVIVFTTSVITGPFNTTTSVATEETTRTTEIVVATSIYTEPFNTTTSLPTESLATSEEPLTSETSFTVFSNTSTDVIETLVTSETPVTFNTLLTSQTSETPTIFSNTTTPSVAETETALTLQTVDPEASVAPDQSTFLPSVFITVDRPLPTTNTTQVSTVETLSPDTGVTDPETSEGPTTQVPTETQDITETEDPAEIDETTRTTESTDVVTTVDPNDEATTARPADETSEQPTTEETVQLVDPTTETIVSGSPTDVIVDGPDPTVEPTDNTPQPTNPATLETEETPGPAPMDPVTSGPQESEVESDTSAPVPDSSTDATTDTPHAAATAPGVLDPETTESPPASQESEPPVIALSEASSNPTAAETLPVQETTDPVVLNVTITSEEPTVEATDTTAPEDPTVNPKNPADAAVPESVTNSDIPAAETAVEIPEEPANRIEPTDTPTNNDDDSDSGGGGGGGGGGEETPSPEELNNRVLTPWPIFPAPNSLLANHIPHILGRGILMLLSGTFTSLNTYDPIRHLTSPSGIDGSALAAPGAFNLGNVGAGIMTVGMGFLPGISYVDTTHCLTPEELKDLEDQEGGLSAAQIPQKCEPRMSVNQTIIDVVLLSLGLNVAVLLLAMSRWFKKPANITADPTTIAGVAAVMGHPEVEKEFGSFPGGGNGKELGERLKGRRFMLGEWWEEYPRQGQEGQQRQGGDGQDISASGDGYGGFGVGVAAVVGATVGTTRGLGAAAGSGQGRMRFGIIPALPIEASPPSTLKAGMLAAVTSRLSRKNRKVKRHASSNASGQDWLRSRLYVDIGMIVLALVMMGVALAALAYIDTPQRVFPEWLMGSSWAGRVVFALIGGLVAFYWGQRFADAQSLAPYAPLDVSGRRHGGDGAEAKATVLMGKYSIPLTAIVPLYKAGHGVAAVIALTALVAEVLVVALAGLPYRTGQLRGEYLACGIAAVVLLGEMVGVVLVIIWWRHRGLPQLPRRPDSVGVVMTYVAQTGVVRDLGGLEGLKGKERDRVVQDMGKRYGYGMREGRWVVDVVDHGGGVGGEKGESLLGGSGNMHPGKGFYGHGEGVSSSYYASNYGESHGRQSDLGRVSDVGSGGFFEQRSGGGFEYQGPRV